MLWLFLLALSVYYIRNLLHVTSHANATLRTPVSRLSRTDITILILLIILKYPFKLLRLLPRLTASDHGFLLPQQTITARVQFDSSDIERYRIAASSSSSSSSASSSNLLLIPGLINPLMSIMLASRNSPVLPFGCVNTCNRFEFVDPDCLADPTALESIQAVASLGGFEHQARRVKRGMEFDILFVVTALKPGQLKPSTIFKQTATILMYLPSNTAPRFRDTSTSPASSNDLDQNAATAAWHTAADKSIKLAFSAPRKWAAVCKDYNPIHMSAALAKLFGFPTKIAHGNHVLACALTQLEPDFLHLTQSERPFAINVAFKRPMPLPLQMELDTASSPSDGTMLRVTNKEKEHLIASVELL